MMTIGHDVVDMLTYRSYCYNRQYSPHVSVARWERIYGPAVWTMEARRIAENA